MFSHLLALIERWRSRRHCQDMPPASAQDDINLAALRLLDDLARRMETTASSSAAKETIRQYQHISPENLLKDLPHIYLWVEQAISTQDTLEIIRSEVRDVHPALMDLSHFALIFEDNAQQEIVLSVQYITLTVDETYTMIGETQDNILLTLKAWIQTLPDRAGPRCRSPIVRKHPYRKQPTTGSFCCVPFLYNFMRRCRACLENRWSNVSLSGRTRKWPTHTAC